MEVYVDAARGDEAVGLAWCIILPSGKEITGSRNLDGSHTSMEAEYYALLDGLRMARRHGDEVVAFCDCQPLVEKMTFATAPGSDDWRDRRAGVQRLLEKFDSADVEWTPRSSNGRADRLAYESLERARRS